MAKVVTGNTRPWMMDVTVWNIWFDIQVNVVVGTIAMAISVDVSSGLWSTCPNICPTQSKMRKINPILNG